MSSEKKRETYFLSAMEMLKDEVKKWIATIPTATLHGVLLFDICQEVTLHLLLLEFPFSSPSFAYFYLVSIFFK
jgi:hypothetical protein